MGGEGDDKQTMVDNPEYQELVQFKAEVSGQQETLSQALKSANQAMAAHAWTGPSTATAFSSELSGRAGQLPGLVGQILDAIDQRMSEVPKKIASGSLPWANKPMPQ